MTPIKITLVPGQPYEYAGQFGYVRVLAASADIKVVTDTNINTTLRAGLGGDVSLPVFSAEPGLEQVVIGRKFANYMRLESKVQQSVELMVSAFELTDQTVAGVVALSPVTSVAAAATIDAASGGATVAADERAEVMLSADENNSAPFWVGGVVGQGTPIYPKEKVVYPVDGAINVIAENDVDKLYVLKVGA